MGAILVALGDVHHAAGDSAPARRAWLAAVRVYEDVGDPTADRVRDRLRRMSV